MTMPKQAWLAGGGNPNHDESGRFAPGGGGGSAKAPSMGGRPESKADLWNREVNERQAAARQKVVNEGVDAINARRYKEGKPPLGSAEDRERFKNIGKPVDWAKAEEAGKKYVAEQTAKGKAKIASVRRTEDRKLKEEERLNKSAGPKKESWVKAEKVKGGEATQARVLRDKETGEATGGVAFKLGCGAKKRWTE